MIILHDIILITITVRGRAEYFENSMSGTLHNRDDAVCLCANGPACVCACVRRRARSRKDSHRPPPPYTCIVCNSRPSTLVCAAPSYILL